jgi:hypothetical protein
MFPYRSLTCARTDHFTPSCAFYVQISLQTKRRFVQYRTSSVAAGRLRQAASQSGSTAVRGAVVPFLFRLPLFSVSLPIASITRTADNTGPSYARKCDVTERLHATPVGRRRERLTVNTRLLYCFQTPQ